MAVCFFFAVWEGRAPAPIPLAQWQAVFTGPGRSSALVRLVAGNLVVDRGTHRGAVAGLRMPF